MPAQNIGVMDLLSDSEAFEAARLPISAEVAGKWLGRAITGAALRELIGTALILSGEDAPAASLLTEGRRALYFRVESDEVTEIHVSLDGETWKELPHIPYAGTGNRGRAAIIGGNDTFELHDPNTAEEYELLWEAGSNIDDSINDTDTRTIIYGMNFSDYSTLVFWVTDSENARRGQFSYCSYDFFRLMGDTSIGTLGAAVDAAGHVQFTFRDGWVGIRWLSDTQFRRTSGAIRLRKIYGIRTQQDL